MLSHFELWNIVVFLNYIIQQIATHILHPYLYLLSMFSLFKLLRNCPYEELLTSRWPCYSILIIPLIDPYSCSKPFSSVPDMASLCCFSRFNPYYNTPHSCMFHTCWRWFSLCFNRFNHSHTIRSGDQHPLVCAVLCYYSDFTV